MVRIAWPGLRRYDAGCNFLRVSVFTKFMAKDDGASLIVFCYYGIAILTGFLFRRPKVGIFTFRWHLHWLAAAMLFAIFMIPLEMGWAGPNGSVRRRFLDNKRMEGGPGQNQKRRLSLTPNFSWVG